MSNIKSEIGTVLVAATAIIFTALVASCVIPVHAADGNSSSSINSTSASPLNGGSNGTNATSLTGSTANSTGSASPK